MYPPFPAYTRPNILDYTQSAELDAQFFFEGTPYEMVARNYTAVTLNLANNSTLTQYDVTGTRLCSTVPLSYMHPFMCKSSYLKISVCSTIQSVILVVLISNG